MISSAILGLWLFTSLIYQGESMPLPNPALKIQYQFEDTGLNTLRYHREGEQGFCERRAVYEFASGKLVQQVVWVNPQNAIWCDQDVDMRLGYQSWTEAWLKDGKLHLVIQMGEEDLIYVWEKQKESSL
ncbi:MAG: hypothetical protein KUL82_03960 [Bdellovibrio sp.]|uniref:hypothetical protein n=1 Tax=Bdellovibrio sp. TaxID=28201 RepID=UPI0039E46C04|nr:hypothetical protein [Bdellovibrio sp.]